MNKENFEEWIRVAEYLKQAKAREMELRKEIIAELGECNVGTSKTVLFDTELKVSITERLSLDNDMFEEIAVNLNEDEMACIIHKPSIDKRAYDKLPDNNSLSLNCVTRKQNVPSIKLA